MKLTLGALEAWCMYFFDIVAPLHLNLFRGISSVTEDVVEGMNKYLIHLEIRPQHRLETVVRLFPSRFRESQSLLS